MNQSAKPRFLGALPFLILLFAGALAAAFVVPFMAFYIVEGLGHQPWYITVYTGLAITSTVILNRLIAARVDKGAKFRPFMMLCSLGFLGACTALTVAPHFAVLITLGVLGFSLANTAMSTMFTFGRTFADAKGFDAATFNVWLRATTSFAWMIGPTLAYGIVYQANLQLVFQMGIGVGLLWFVLVCTLVPRDAARDGPGPNSDGSASQGLDRQLWLATCVCFFFALAHLLCSASLPLYYVQEVGLPSFAPGVSFAIKTGVEIIAILTTPKLMKRFGARTILMACAALAIAAFMVLANITNLPTMMIGAAMEGLYYGIFAAVSVTFVQSFAGERMGRATSMYVNALMIGALIANPSVGLIAQFFDFRTAILLASVGAVFALVLLLAMPSNEKAAASPG